MKFIKKQYILDNNVDLILIDKRLPYEIEENLTKKDIKIIKTTECSNLYNAIKYHPDISVCKLDYNNIVVAPNVHYYYNNILSNYKFNIIKGFSTLESKYPNNIQYNVAFLGNFAIHNFKYTDKKILDFIENNNITKINVSQGYSKCCICIVDDNSIITSDIGIHKEVIKYGIDSLLIQNGHIDLFELNYGFIGGCSGLLSKDELAFLGDIKKHPDFEKIYDFTSRKNIKITSLGKNKLLDLGSIIPLTKK